MRLEIKVLVLLSLAILAAPAARAQDRGDSIRVRYRIPTGEARASGRYLARDSTHLDVRVQLTDVRIALDSVIRLDRWQPSHAGVQILIGAAVFTAGQLVWYAVDDEFGGWLGRDELAANLALNAGIGAVLGGLTYLLWPGSWKRVRW